MKKLEIYDPPLCCSTDPPLVQFAADLAWAAKQGVKVERHNLSREPELFTSNPGHASRDGRRTESAPYRHRRNARIISTGSYPSRERLAELLGITLEKGAWNLPFRRGCCG